MNFQTHIHSNRNLTDSRKKLYKTYDSKQIVKNIFFYGTLTLFINNEIVKITFKWQEK